MSTSSLTVRAATQADIVVITGLLTQLSRAEGKPTTANVGLLTKALFAAERKVEVQALLVLSDAQVVGAALYYPGYDILTSSYGYHLADFVVDEDWRRRGVGKYLVGQLAAQNLAAGGQWISLTVLKKNEAAKEFYKVIGMTHVAMDFFAIGPQGLAALASGT